MNSPWPIVIANIDMERVNSLIPSASVETVDITDLMAQHNLREEKLRNVINNPKPTMLYETLARRDKPILVIKDGKRIIYDGHHRLAATLLKGKTTAEVYVIHDYETNHTDPAPCVRIDSPVDWG
jgi:hypothetical protein